MADKVFTEHSYRGYVLGCRCDVCRQANARRVSERRRILKNGGAPLRLPRQAVPAVPARVEVPESTLRAADRHTGPLAGDAKASPEPSSTGDVEASTSQRIEGIYQAVMRSGRVTPWDDAAQQLEDEALTAAREIDASRWEGHGQATAEHWKTLNRAMRELQDRFCVRKVLMDS
jgi:hypothetical protein